MADSTARTATRSHDVGAMLLALADPASPVDRHFLLLGLVEHFYHRKDDPEARAKLVEIGMTHMRELHDLRSAWAAGNLHVPTPLYLARVLCQDGQYDQATDVWRMAAAAGYVGKAGLQRELDGIEKRRRKNERAAAKR